MKPFLRAIMKEIWVARGKEKGKKNGQLMSLGLSPRMLKFAGWMGNK